MPRYEYIGPLDKLLSKSQFDTIMKQKYPNIDKRDLSEAYDNFRQRVLSNRDKFLIGYRYC